MIGFWDFAIAKPLAAIVMVYFIAWGFSEAFKGLITIINKKI